MDMDIVEGLTIKKSNTNFMTYYGEDNMKICKLICLCMLFPFYTCLVYASEPLQVRFGNKLILFPTPSGFCLLGGTTQEDQLFEWQKDIQFNMGNKLFGMWVDCETKREILKNRMPEYFDQWVIATGTLTGDQKTEQTYQISAKTFNEIMVGEMDFSEISKMVEKNLEDANTVHFADKDVVKIGELIDLGVLGVSDSVHRGVIMKVNDNYKERLVSGVTGIILINNVPIGVHFYTEYEDNKTIEKLLSNSKSYSANLFYAN